VPNLILEFCHSLIIPSNSPQKYLRHARLYLDAQRTMGFIHNKMVLAGAIFFPKGIP
jgi:hypothetical protein